jgi:hypothetical protein
MRYDKPSDEMTLTKLDLSESVKQLKIAALAYEFRLARAFRRGSPAEDWLRAEREVRGKAGAVKLRRTPVGNFLVA